MFAQYLLRFEEVKHLLNKGVLRLELLRHDFDTILIWNYEKSLGVIEQTALIRVTRVFYFIRSHIK